MRERVLGWMAAATAVVLLVAVPVAGQAPAAAVRRTADGKPDLSGVWQVANTANFDLLAHASQKGVPAGLGVVEGNEIPYLAGALETREENFANRATADPELKCFLPGVPRITYMPHPFQIFQTPNQIAITYEYVHAVRRIYMNSPHPEGPIEWFMGDSRGKWDGDTLVVDVIYFTNQTWLDRTGHYHSEELHVVERYTPVNANQINYEVTLEDPKVFSGPWKMSMPLYRRLEPNIRPLEFECYTFGLERTWLRPPN